MLRLYWYRTETPLRLCNAMLRLYRDSTVAILRLYWDSSFCLQIVRPVSALLVIDVQNDFISGSLAITNCPAGQNGEEVGKCNSPIIVNASKQTQFAIDWFFAAAFCKTSHGNDFHCCNLVESRLLSCIVLAGKLQKLSVIFPAMEVVVLEIEVVAK